MHDMEVHNNFPLTNFGIGTYDIICMISYPSVRKAISLFLGSKFTIHFKFFHSYTRKQSD
jgi:hypothetical protein